MAFSWDNVHVTVDPSVVLCEVHHINIARATKVKKNHVRWVNVIRSNHGKPAHTVLAAEACVLQDCASQYSVYKLDTVVTHCLHTF